MLHNSAPKFGTFLWATQYIVIVRKWFFVYMSSNSEPIRTRFHTVMRAQMGRFPGNCGRHQSRTAKMAQKKIFIGIQRHFSVAYLCEIRRQHVNGVVIQPFRKELLNISEKRSLSPTKKTLFEVCFSGCLIISLQTN